MHRDESEKRVERVDRDHNTRKAYERPALERKRLATSVNGGGGSVADAFGEAQSKFNG